MEMIDKSVFIQDSILRDMSEGVLVIGLDGSIQYFNQAAVDILEKTEEELSNQKFGSFFLMTIEMMCLLKLY